MSQPPSVVVDERSILIRIPQLWDPGMSDDELYDATRGHWKLGPRRELAELALAVVAGVVHEVYRIESWHRAGTTPSATAIHTSAPPDRWEFVGKPAEEALRSKYVGRSVKGVKGYFSQGNQNPIRYVNCGH